MAEEQIQENIREIFIDLEEIPNSLIFKIPDIEEIPGEPISEKFGFNDWKKIEYYFNRIPAGLIEQFPCLYYMLENYWQTAIQKTPLEEMEERARI
jgi:hypothetical protein